MWFFFQADPWPSGKFAWASSRDAAGPAWGGGNSITNTFLILIFLKKGPAWGKGKKEYFEKLNFVRERKITNESLDLADVKMWNDGID